MTKVLVIEDEAQIRDEVIDWFQFEGYKVVGAANGRLGLQAAHAELPDIILCDVAMPEMGGHEVLSELRSDAQLNRTPFIFMTASADRDSIRRGMTLGADDYLTKPFTRDEVLTAVRSRLERQAVQDSQIQSQLDLMNHLLLEEREKHLLKSRLVAIFSHDFRNPLASILSSSTILRNYGDRLSPEGKKQHLDHIDGSVQQLLQMLDDMLMVAEVESGRLQFAPQRIDITELVQAIVGDFRLIDQDDHVLAFHSTVHHWVEVDPKLLRHILTNLVSNAIKYSPSGAEITVTLDEQEDCLTLIVEDHGIGIPEENLSQLFQPFFRAANAKHIKGTGLGLNIVKECVNCHNGQITVESQVDRGTRMTVQLPLKIVP